MKIAHDIFSETNPAFGAYAVVSFTKAYLSVNGDGPELPKIYLALPVALSGDLSRTFDGTNKKTGLSEWLVRSPQAEIDLAERVNATMGIVTEAIRFGCFARVLRLGINARITIGDQKLKKSAMTALSAESTQVLKRAERLGFWFASAGSTQAAFNIMELTT